MKKVILLVFVTSFFFTCENETIGDCSISATVRDLTGLDGCGFVFELADGSRIEPQQLIRCGTLPLAKEEEITEDPLYNFEFVDGKKVRVSYTETNGVSICMVGPTVKITCIEEVTEFPEE